MTAAHAHTGPISDERPRTAVATTNETQSDIGLMSDKEFERAFQAVELRKKRVARILESFLIEGKHYGNPDVGNGRKAFQKPILYQAGAEELRSIFGWTPVEMAPPVIESSAEFVSVRVTIGIEDRNGRIIAIRGGACTSKEKRFKRRDGKGFTYEDARETLHDCVAMAEKRAGNLGTRAAAGLTGYLGAEDDEENTQEAEQDNRPLTPWTEPEKARVFDAARAKGMTRGNLKQLTLDTLGRAEVGAGQEVDQLIAAIAQWTKPAPATAAGKTDETPAATNQTDVAAPETPAAAAPPAAEDFQDDRDLIEEPAKATPAGSLSHKVPKPGAVQDALGLNDQTRRESKDALRNG